MSLHSVHAAGVLIRENGHVPVIRRADNGAWESLGGVMEMEERPEGGVCREVLEDAGVKVRVEHPSGVYKNTTRGIIALVLLCRPVGGEETGPSTHSTTRPPVRAHDGYRLL
jgi:ADP-ribose pyrophosphatase YjhB (NUDIX family)